MYPVGILGVSCLDPNFGQIELFFMANMGFFGVEKSFLTFIGTSEYVFYLYSVYSVCILGVSCLDPNFGPIELYFTANMGFFGMRSSFLTFFYTFE